MENALGWLSVLPPVIVITLAILTKNVLFSLLIGVFIGVFLCGQPVPAGAALSFWEWLAGTPARVLDVMTGTVSSPENLQLLLFLALLGGFIAILTAVGCGNAFSDMAVRRIRSRTQAQLFALLLGCLIFIDDYFNALTVGNVMVPITDKLRVSRAKLSYIIDSTSAPVTILMPVSSWVATVISLITPVMAAYGFTRGGMDAFLRACPYNYYAWLTLLMVFLVAVLKLDIGPMAGFERDFQRTGRDRSAFADVNEDVIDSMSAGRKGTAFDLIFLVCSLVALAIVFMLSTGGFFGGGVGLGAAFMGCDATRSLVYAAACTLLLAFLMFVPFRKMSFRQFNDAFVQGVKSMVLAICILILSWSFSEVLGDNGLGTGRYIAALSGGRLPAWLMPAVIFVIAAFISFTTGASWGALAIMLPTSVAVCAAVEPALLEAVLGATLAGAVFGDHCSPLSDTTVLSSSGAGCNHLDHVISQMPYALITAGVSAVGYLITGFTNSAPLALGAGAAALTAIAFFFGRRRRGEAKAEETEGKA